MSDRKCPVCNGPESKVPMTFKSPVYGREIEFYEVHCDDKECGMTYLPLSQEEKISSAFHDDYREAAEKGAKMLKEATDSLKHCKRTLDVVWENRTNPKVLEQSVLDTLTYLELTFKTLRDLGAKDV